jgi:citrate lyase subunit beta/citryl-CoA lyase
MSAEDGGVARGEAGRRGAAVRSDCWIELELKAHGGLAVQIASKVQALYGEAITEQIAAGCADLGIEHASVTVEDQGALPWTVAARLEAAARRADPSLQSELLPPLLSRVRGASGPDRASAVAGSPGGAVPARERLRRSRLYLPGNEPKFFVNAGLHGPDGIILDLEDSVAPAEKDAARVLVRNALRVIDFGAAERMVRINQGERGLADLAWVVPHGVQVILVPKVEDPASLVAVARRVEELRAHHRVAQPIHLMPIVESALGAWRAYEIAAAHELVVALAIGLEDYTADLGVPRTLEGRESFWARCQVVNGARAAGVQPIDTVFSDVADSEGLRASVREARALGFVGKGCIHPRQIPIVHEAFAPEPAEIERAQRIVLAFEEAQRQGLGVVALGSKMIDPPVVKRALATVRAAIGAGKLAPDWRQAGARADGPPGQPAGRAAQPGKGGRT